MIENHLFLDIIEILNLIEILIRIIENGKGKEGMERDRREKDLFKKKIDRRDLGMELVL